MTDADDIAAMPFEAALKELETIVSKLEGGDVALDESIAIYERAAALRAHCEAKLKSAEARIDAIVVDGEGRIGTKPLDGESA